jgi:hypothetical protein
MTDPTPDPVEHDLELTTSALKDGPTALGLAGGVLEINRWLDRIDGTNAPAVEEIGAVLVELRGELQSDAPDTAVIADLMRRLAERTLAAADDQPEGNLRSRLQELGHLLTSGAGEL